MSNFYLRITAFVVLLFTSANFYSQNTDTLDININCLDGGFGQQRCFEFRSSDIVGLSSIQFSISYDPSVLSYVSPVLTGTCLEGLTDLEINNPSPGIIGFLWAPSSALDLAENCLLFSLCFNFIGNPGECSTVQIGQYPTEIEVGTETGVAVLSSDPCEACVIPNQMTVVPSYCVPSTSTSNDASLIFYTVGGTAPYSYNVSGPVNSSGSNISDGFSVVIPDLPLGTYTITVTDANGLIRVVNRGIFDTGKATYTIEKFLPSCFYRDDGVIRLKNINVTNPPYSIKWNIGYFNVDTIVELYTGNYQVTIIDANGCKNIENIDLTIDTLKFDVAIIDSAFCLGKNASINVNATGGSPFPGNAYKIKVGGLAASTVTVPFNFPSVPSGNQKIIVEDNAINYLNRSNPCIIEKTVFIPYKNKTQYNTLVLDDVSCKGEMDGKVLVEMSGIGTRFKLVKAVDANGVQIDPLGAFGSASYMNNELKPGSYYIITEATQPVEANGCRDTFKFEINEPINPLIVNAAVVNATCNGPGSIKINAIGGAVPYSYKWNDIITDTDERLNLNAGDYIVTVSDGNGCDSILSIKITDIGVPVDSPVVQKAISCKDFADGEVTVNGNSAATYMWEDDMGTFIDDTKAITGLSTGWYFVTINANGCQKQDSVFLFNPDGLEIVDVEKIVPECPGDGALGSIGVTVEGGFPGYNFRWTDVTSGNQVGGNNSVLAPVEGGNYNVRISDQNNCFIDTTIVLDGAVDFNIALSGIVNISCNGLSDGQATATATLGPINNGRYSFFWSSGEQSQSANFNRHAALNLSEGENWVFVTDSKCKSDTIFFTITAPPVIEVTSQSSGLCSGSCSGQIELTVSGGSSNNTFNTTTWQGTNQTGNTLFNLCEGSYPFLVEDLNGCQLRDTVILVSSDSIEIVLDENASELLSCRNNIGQLAITVTGGIPSYFYNWTNNVSTSNIASDLPQGIYNVTVTDQSGCSATFSYNLTRPNDIIVDIEEPQPPLCFGGKSCIRILSVSGGTGDTYTMQINNGLRIPIDSCYETFAGEYLISIYDEAGCKTDNTVTIEQPNPISVELGEDIKLNLGEESPVIESFVASDEVIVSYNWSGVDTINCLDDICSSITVNAIKNDLTLTLTVVDENGCTGQDEINFLVSDRRNVYIPNIIKPTGSLENQRFDLSVGFGVVQVDELLIYDRWGNVVFKNSNYMPDETTGWDGSFNGNNLLPGVYVYSAKVSFLDGQNRIYKGDITLIK